MKKNARTTERRQAGPALRPSVGLAYWPRIEKWIARRAVGLSVALVLLATIRIVLTYPSLSYTWDEPGHVASGVELWAKGTYTYDQSHPTLTRLAVGLLPRLAGAHSWGRKTFLEEGLSILSDGGGRLNMRTLSLARAGILPFFWVACGVTFLFTRWVSADAAAAVIAVFLFTMIPTVLAHSGLATTDMGLTAMLLLAVYSGARWLEEPVMWRAVLFGVSTGLAVLAKFSTLAFLPSIAVVGILLWLGIERPAPARILARVRERSIQFAAAVAIGAVVIWAGYLFSFGVTPDFRFPVPAPELFRGIELIRDHNSGGNLTYLMGAVNMVGWPQFYVVALGVKTPLPVLVLGIVGFILLFSRRSFGTRGWVIISIALGILIFSSFFSNIRIGTRHVLPVYGAFSTAGACAAASVLRRWHERRLALYAIGFLLLYLVAGSVSGHPDYLAYFNSIAGSKPEDFLVDSDLDWGQDVGKLAARLKELNVQEVYFRQYAPGDLQKLFGFPPIRPLDVRGPHPGWNAVSLTPLKYGEFDEGEFLYDPGFHFWPDQLQPEERIGASILLFHIQPGR